MVYKLGTAADAIRIASLPLPAEVMSVIQNDLAVLDREYGADRNVDASDGGFLLYCTLGTKHDEIKSFFDAENHIPEWVERIRDAPAYSAALYLLTNDFAVEIVMATADVSVLLNDEEERCL